ncbi:MAG: hypothetical protein HY744_02200 [Deltaproteobacteria bacterium]|nr:hypothetical protein [Deltaproteobacteria bacterium]
MTLAQNRHPSSFRFVRRAVLAGAAAALALLCLAAPAWAIGSIDVKETRVKEMSGGRWRLKVTIDYGSVPHFGHVSMIFNFKPKVLFERYVDDGSPETPKVEKKDVTGQPDINLPMDVDFADATGQVFRKTRFDFPLGRSSDFFAGEYDMTVKIEGGKQVGRTMRIVLEGENDVQDRRSIIFHGSPPPKPKPKPKEEPGADAGAEPGSAEGEAATEEPEAPVGEEPAGPPEVPPRQGGCGCRVGAPAPTWPGLLALAAAAALGAAGARRRRAPR